MHDQLLAYAVRLAVDAPDPNAVKVAMVGLAGVVVTTAGTVLLALRSPSEARSSRRESRGDSQYHSVLRAQVAAAERRAKEACEQRDEARARVRVYERWLWLHHLDPQKISTGDEVADNVRI